MMKMLILVGRILGIVFPYKLMVKMRLVKDIIRTGYYKSIMKELGDGTIIKKNVKIIGANKISIGKKCVILPNTVLSTWQQNTSNIPCLIIKDGVHIGDGCHLTANNLITIGKGTLLGKHITITDNSHGDMDKEDSKVVPYKRKVISKGPVVIGDRVWIGDKATILPGVSIGDAAIIGANSVVTKDVPSRSVVVGVPARIINYF